jgi:hypothetical protein
MTGAAQGPAGTSQEAAFEVVFLDARPELTLPALELLAAGWPEFMQHDPVAERHQARLATELAGFQALLLDDKDELAALGVAIPSPGTGPWPACRPAGTRWSPRALSVSWSRSSAASSSSTAGSPASRSEPPNGPTGTGGSGSSGGGSECVFESMGATYQPHPRPQPPPPRMWTTIFRPRFLIGVG